METQDAINKRSSVRDFSNKPVKFDLVLEAIDAANQAPFAGNINNLRFVILEKKESKSHIAEFSQQYWISDAQWVVLVCSENSKLENLYQDRGEMYSRQQAGAAIQNMLLSLTAQGLASCWVGAFSGSEIKSKFKIPEQWNIEAIIPIGYPKIRAVKKKRKIDVENKIFWGSWNEKYKPRKYPYPDPGTN